MELVGILIPGKSAEPYRNVKNLGILLDLIQIFGESKNRLNGKSQPERENRNQNANFINSDSEADSTEFDH
jgi:hypothetical protein